RNQVDTQTAQTSGMRKNELLLGSSEPAPVARPARHVAKRRASRPKMVAEDRQTIEVIKGLNKSEMAF
ncbi:MAG: hypothetical protein ACM3KD_12645, partial [Hyphomicrobiaceae bacterium]